MRCQPHDGGGGRRVPGVRADGEGDDGAFIRENFFNSPELKALVEHLSDDQLANLKRGGHDPLKVYAAYKAATEHKGQPTVILVKTVKGYGIPGDGGEGKNTTHQLKALKLTVKAEPSETDLRKRRRRSGRCSPPCTSSVKRFDLPVPKRNSPTCPSSSRPPTRRR